MAEVIFNNQGVPLMAFGSSHFMQTTGAPVKPPKIAEPKIYNPDKVSVGNLEISSWGVSNNFPSIADEVINKVGVLNAGLKFTRNFTIGQGIFPVRVTGYTDKGDEKLEMVDDPKLRAFANSRLVRRYLEKALRDFLKFGAAFVQLIPNADGSNLVGLQTINARYSRLTVADKYGVINNCVVSGYWPDTPSEVDAQVYDVLDEYDPYADLQRRKFGGKIKGKSFIYVIRDSWNNNEYYSGPIWYSAYLAGWVDIALNVPKFLRKAYENQISWKWHVQIPYAFWDKKFPTTEYPDVSLRKAAIETYLDSIEENLTNPENSNKAIFTFFEVNPVNQKIEEQWIITALDNKLNAEQNLISSAAANSEILFSLMINPNVLGAGMPGGTYAGNQGGSNIREAFLVNIANAWLDRQNLLDPLEAFIRFNGSKDDIEWRFRNTVLTTLDSGAGTIKTLS
jgi:hypothetical protein